MSETSGKTKLQLVEDDAGQLWGKQAKETKRQYEAFRHYRDMGAGRSIAKVAKRLKKNISGLLRWSSKNRWVERANAWDQFDEQRQNEAQQAAREKMAQENCALAMSFKALSAKALTELHKRIEHNPSILSKMSPQMLMYIFDNAQRIERENRGEPDQKDGGVIVEVNVKRNDHLYKGAKQNFSKESEDEGEDS